MRYKYNWAHGNAASTSHKNNTTSKQKWNNTHIIICTHIYIYMYTDCIQYTHVKVQKPKEPQTPQNLATKTQSFRSLQCTFTWQEKVLGLSETIPQSWPHWTVPAHEKYPCQFLAVSFAVLDKQQGFVQPLEQQGRNYTLIYWSQMPGTSWNWLFPFFWVAQGWPSGEAKESYDCSLLMQDHLHSRAELVRQRNQWSLPGGLHLLVAFY